MSRAPEPLTVVICVDHASVTGGQAKVAIESAIGLKRFGARPILFAAVAPVDSRLADAGVEVVCLGQHDLVGNPSMAAAALQGTWNVRAKRELAGLLARLPPERTLVHVHGWAKALSPAIAEAIQASGLPAVYTIHEYFLFCPNGGFYNYQKHEVCKLAPMSAACVSTHCDSRDYARKLWRVARLFAAQRYAKFADVFSDYICISDYQSQIVAPYLPAGVATHRLSNPIEASDLGPKPNPASGEFVFVGRLSPEKGAYLFAEAAALAGLTPTFIGDGPIADELRARHPGARFLGWREPAEVRESLRAARALVFPSLWYEGQPLTVLEAKAMGTPVIVSDICAGREEIEDGETGLWFESADVGALAAALERMKDDALVARLSHAAHASYWRDPPTLEAHVIGLTGVYRGMLERRRAAAPGEAEARVSGAPPLVERYARVGARAARKS
jgi:glycosyltransferase involved in cell wall biosynthesis